MHESVLKFGWDHIPRELAGQRVLDVGAQDVNGSMRPICRDRGCTDYTGVDLVAGPGVDVVAPIETLSYDREFDGAVCCEMLEHAEHWPDALRVVKRAVKMGGWLLFTCRGPGFPWHNPPDHWRFSVDALVEALDGFRGAVQADPQVPGVFFFGRRVAEEFTTASALPARMLDPASPEAVPRFALRPGSRVFVFSPHNETGGTEWLHQIAHGLRQAGVEAGVVYVGTSETQPPAAYAGYGEQPALGAIRPEDIAIVPDPWPDLAEKLAAEGVQTGLSIGKVRSPWRAVSQRILHIGCSVYAVNEARKYTPRVAHLSDYVGTEFAGPSPPLTQRQNLVLYGPRGAQWAEQLAMQFRGADFRQIDKPRLPRAADVADLMRSAKVFLEAGWLGGRDRLPREAALCGCIVVMRRTGSGAVFADAPLDDWCRPGTLDEAGRAVAQALNDSSTAWISQESYRAWVAAARDRFPRQLADLFGLP